MLLILVIFSIYNVVTNNFIVKEKEYYAFPYNNI